MKTPAYLLLAFILGLLASSFVEGQTIIDAKPGQQVVLPLDIQVPQEIFNRELTDYSWIVRPAGAQVHKVIDKDGKPYSVIVAPSTGSLEVEGFLLDFDAKLYARQHFVIKVSGPAPPPKPDDDITPPTPDNEGFLKLTSIALKNMDTVPADARHHAKAIAGNFRSVSSQILAIQGMTKATALKRVQDLNSQTVGSDRGKWLKWFYIIGFAIDAHEDNGKVPDAATLAKCFDALADGLEKAND